MENDLTYVNADLKKFRETTEKDFLNIRFRFQDANINEELEEIAEDDVNITTNHYKLLPKKTENINFDYIEIDGGGDEENDDPGNRKNTLARKRSFNTECEYDPYHDKMQNCLFDLLNCGYEGYNNVRIEKGRVDIKAKNSSGKWHYFEIKTDGPKPSIRRALGQVMEYAYFPSKLRAEKLVVIADEEPGEDVIEYLKFIRAKFGLDIYYRHLNIHSGILSKEF